MLVLCPSELQDRLYLMVLWGSGGGCGVSKEELNACDLYLVLQGFCLSLDSCLSLSFLVQHIPYPVEPVFPSEPACVLWGIFRSVALTFFVPLLCVFALLGQVVSRPPMKARLFSNPCVAKISTSNLKQTNKQNTIQIKMKCTKQTGCINLDLLINNKHFEGLAMNGFAFPHCPSTFASSLHATEPQAQAGRAEGGIFVWLASQNWLSFKNDVKFFDF